MRTARRGCRVEQEILPKASITDQRHQSRVCATTNQDPQPRHHSQLSPRSTYWRSRHHQRGLEPSSSCQRFSPVSMFQPMFIQDHDPLLETNTGAEEPAWMGHSLSRARTRLRTFFVLGNSAKKPLTRPIQSFRNTSWEVQRRG